MFVVIAHYRTDSQNAATVGKFLFPLAAASRAEPGNRGYEVLAALDEPGLFVIVEHYVDREAFDAHLSSPHFNDLAVARIRPLLTERTVEFLTEISGAT